jgi:FMN reductase
MPAPSVVALVGNPRPGSRTAGAARALADSVAARVLDGAEVRTVDLALLAGELFTPGAAAPAEARAAVAAAGVVVVATPVHKASFTGLLKGFLDGYGPDALAGVVAVPLVVSGDPAHALVGEVHLRPVLVELGALVPTRSLTVVDSALADLDPVLERWWDRAAAPLGRVLRPQVAGVAS